MCTDLSVMTSAAEEGERGRKETVSTQGGGGKEQRERALTRVGKIVEIVGTSDKSWEDAAMVAVQEAKKQFGAYAESRLRI